MLENNASAWDKHVARIIVYEGIILVDVVTQDFMQQTAFEREMRLVL